MSRPSTPLPFDKERERQRAIDNAMKKKSGAADDVQKKTFTKWINAQLGKQGSSIDNLEKDLRDGRKLLMLMEIVSGEPVRKPEKQNMRLHHIQNVGGALKFLENKLDGSINLSVGPEDVVDGNVKMTLGLIWVMIVRFQLNKALFAEQQEEGGGPRGRKKKSNQPDAKTQLLAWVQQELADYAGMIPPITDLSRSWQSGEAFLALVHRFSKSYVPNFNTYLGKTSQESWERTMNRAFSLAHKNMDIPPLLDPQDIVYTDAPDEKSIMTYLSEFYVAFTTRERPVEAEEEEAPLDEQAAQEVQVAVDELNASTQATSIVVQSLHDTYSLAFKEDLVSAEEVSGCIDMIPFVQELVATTGESIVAHKDVIFKYENFAHKTPAFKDAMAKANAVDGEYVTAVSKINGLEMYGRHLQDILKASHLLEAVNKAIGELKTRMSGVITAAKECQELKEPEAIQEQIKEFRQLSVVPNLVITPDYLNAMSKSIATKIPEVDVLLPGYERFYHFNKRVHQADDDVTVIESSMTTLNTFAPTAVDSVVLDLHNAITGKLEGVAQLTKDIPMFEGALSEAPAFFGDIIAFIEKRLHELEASASKMKHNILRSHRFENLESACRRLIGECDKEMEFLNARLNVLLEALKRGKDGASVLEEAMSACDHVQDELSNLYADLSEVNVKMLKDFESDLDLAKEIIRIPEEAIDHLADALTFERNFIGASRLVNHLANMYTQIDDNIRTMELSLVDDEGVSELPAAIDSVERLVSGVNEQRSMTAKSLADSLGMGPDSSSNHLEALEDRYMDLEQLGYQFDARLTKMRDVLQSAHQQEEEAQRQVQEAQDQSQAEKANYMASLVKLQVRITALSKQLAFDFDKEHNTMGTVEEVGKRVKSLRKDVDSAMATTEVHPDWADSDKVPQMRETMEALELGVSAKRDEFNRFLPLQDTLKGLDQRLSAFAKHHRSIKATDRKTIKDRMTALDVGPLNVLSVEVSELTAACSSNAYLSAEAYLLQQNINVELTNAQQELTALKAQLDALTQKRRVATSVDLKKVVPAPIPEHRALSPAIKPRPRSFMPAKTKTAPMSPEPTKRTNRTRANSYIADKKSKLDQKVAEVINSLDMEIKITRDATKEGRYWIGNDADKKLLFCRILNDKMVMVRIGGGWQKMEQYLTHNHKDKRSTVMPPQVDLLESMLNQG